MNTEITTTELANIAKEDGQSIRPFYNYFAQTYEDLEGYKFEFDNVTFNNFNDFADHLISVLETLKKHN